MYKVLNMAVTSAGYRYIGHFRNGELRIVLEGSGFGCCVFPKDEFNFVKLFLVFGIDSEDGVMLECPNGKPCRVIFDENDKPVKLQHITHNQIVWEVK